MSETRATRAGLTRAVGNLALTLAAIGGAICIVFALLALSMNISLIMFKTGSMGPTIPAGSLAAVREVPAAELKVGDIVTVDRGAHLPVTHRITSITPSPSDHARIITMRGDANQADDPTPYTITTARIMLGSVPGLAHFIVWFSHPLVLGTTTAATALLVTWAFWPRRRAIHRSRRTLPPDPPDPPSLPSAAGATSALALSTPPAWTAPADYLKSDRFGSAQSVSLRNEKTRTFAVIVATGLLALIFAPPAAPTLASWNDRESTSAALTARLPAPVVIGCTSRNVLLSGGEIVLKWSYPLGIATTPVPSAALFFSTSGLLDLSILLPGTYSTTGPDADGAYTTTLSSSLLAGILGGSAYAGVSTVQSGWQSVSASVTATVPLLVGTGTCTVTP